jgi:hypothetical protein
MLGEMSLVEDEVERRKTVLERKRVKWERKMESAGSLSPVWEEEED